jgi:hypothetical protein
MHIVQHSMLVYNMCSVVLEGVFPARELCTALKVAAVTTSAAAAAAFAAAAGAPYHDGAASAGDHLRRIFGRMGMSDQEVVALSGAHTLGRARPERSGWGECASTASFHVLHCGCLAKEITAAAVAVAGAGACT